MQGHTDGSGLGGYTIDAAEPVGQKTISVVATDANGAVAVQSVVLTVTASSP